MLSKSIGILISAAALSFGTDILDLPKGTESIALGNTGAAFSNEPNSVILNPANGAFYGARSGLNVWGSFSTGNPFPPKLLPNYKLNIGSIGVYLKKGNFGYSVTEQVEKLKGYKWDDAVTMAPVGDIIYSLALRTSASVQWNDIVGFGASVKPLIFHDSDDSKAFVFDLGLRGQYKKTYNGTFYIIPGAGITFQNLGKDSLTTESGHNYQLYDKTVVGGVSFECGMPDAFWIMAEEDVSKLLVKNDSGLDEKPTFRTGVQIGITPLLQLNFGNEKYSLRYRYPRLNGDTIIENRSEFHWGVTAGYRNIQFMKFRNRKNSSKVFSTDHRNFEILYSFSGVKKDYFGGFKTYTHQISGGIELGKKRN